MAEGQWPWPWPGQSHDSDSESEDMTFTLTLSGLLFQSSPSLWSSGGCFLRKSAWFGYALCWWRWGRWLCAIGDKRASCNLTGDGKSAVQTSGRASWTQVGWLAQVMVWLFSHQAHLYCVAFEAGCGLFLSTFIMRHSRRGLLHENLIQCSLDFTDHTYRSNTQVIYTDHTYRSHIHQISIQPCARSTGLAAVPSTRELLECLQTRGPPNLWSWAIGSSWS